MVGDVGAILSRITCNIVVESFFQTVYLYSVEPDAAFLLLALSQIIASD